MTSKVIVDAHAGWPMQVTAIDQVPYEGVGDKRTVLAVVKPGDKQEFHVTSTRKLLIEEIEPASE